MKPNLVNNPNDVLVESHLRLYLKRSQELWKVYNSAKDTWVKTNLSENGVPREGSFPEVGITTFSRHGYGIRIVCDKEIVEFDFIPKYIEKKDYLHIEEIDIYWSFVHYSSLNPNFPLTEEEWNQSISNLNDQNILTKFSWNKCAFIGYALRG